MSAEEEKELLEVQAKYKVFAAELKTKFKALQTSSFSQALEPAKSALGLTPETKRGIAEALVHRWMAAHAADASLWNELYVTANGVASLDVRALKTLVLSDRTSLVLPTSIEGTGAGPEIVAALRGAAEYAIIGIDGPDSGHFFGAHFGSSGDVGFFDPSFGEYWFDRRSSFERFLAWFVGGRFYRRYTGFRLRSFARSEGAGSVAEREGFEPSVGF